MLLSLLVCKNLTCIIHNLHGSEAERDKLVHGSHKKKLTLVYAAYFLLDFFVNITKSCIREKDKYYVCLNVLKFENFNMHVKVQI